MTRPWMGYLAGTAFVLSMAGAATAYAQSSVQNAQNEAASDSHADRVVRIERHGPGPDLGDGDHHRIERRIVIHHGQDPAEHLRTMLQLKPNQEAALQAYVAAIHPKHGPEGIVEMSGPGPSGHGEARTTTQKLADMEKRLADQSAQAKARIDATRKFYDQLEPSQKKVFDEMPLPGPMMIMPGMGNMRVMVNMDGMPPRHHMDHMMPPPPLPPGPPAPPAPPRLD